AFIVTDGARDGIAERRVFAFQIENQGTAPPEVEYAEFRVSWIDLYLAALGHSDDQLLDDLAVWRHPQSWADGVDLPTWHTGSAKPEPFEWAGERNVEPGDSTKLWSCRHLRLVGQ